MLKPAIALLFAAFPSIALSQEPVREGAVLDLPGADAPSLAVDVLAATDGGWDLRLTPSNVTLTAERVGGAHVPGEGHVRISVDDGPPVEIAETAFHVSPLDAGVHEVAVGLYTNDGQAYARDGALAAERLFILSTGGGSRPAAVEPKTAELAIVGGALAAPGDTFRAALGDVIRLRWSTDSAMELHLHGYDVEAEVLPESPMTMVFEAVIPGRFPIEAHGGGREQTLLYVEVLP